jgi:hypothetical protein
LELFQSYKAGVRQKRVWQKQDKEDNLEQDKEDKKDKQDNPKKDKDELELGTWMLQLHATGDGNSVRAFSNDICSVVGYYAKLCKVSLTQKCANMNSVMEKGVRKRLCRVLNIVYSMKIYQKMKKVTNLSE